MRGGVSAISPVTGYVMSAHAQGENGQKIEEMRVSAEVYANGMDEGTAKKAILNSAMKLYKKYALTIAGELQIAARPDTGIVPWTSFRRIAFVNSDCALGILLRCILYAAVRVDQLWLFLCTCNCFVYCIYNVLCFKTLSKSPCDNLS